MGVVRPSVKRALDRLQDIPTDIEPKFVTADELAPMAKSMPAVKDKVGSIRNSSRSCATKQGRSHRCAWAECA